MSGDLLVALREYDLPPKWDGLLVVEWTPWAAPEPVFICPPPTRRECCPGCGSAYPRVHARGMVANDARTTAEDWAYDRENRRKLGPLAYKRPRIATWRLYAFRCQDCRHDEVWDTHTDEWWELDHTDYGAGGSHG
ncbi:hypothetical protein [Georgenia sp. MJ170]|uniref:hypothetical protein n=1 Tax=Georgenia sunbinii TaxID=3117728 RepID=UPI002F2654F3